MVGDLDLLDNEPSPRTKRGWRRFLLRHVPTVSIGLMVTALVMVVLWPYVVITVPSGQVGVLWYRLIGFDFYCWCFAGRGTVLDPQELKEEGLHVILPWNKLFLYDLRLQSATQTYNAISKDGVSVGVQVNVRYQLVHRSVAVLHKFIGPQYFASVVKSRDRQPDASSYFAVHGRRGLHLTRGHAGTDSQKCETESGHQSQRTGPTRGHGTAGPQTLHRLPARFDPNP